MSKKTDDKKRKLAEKQVYDYEYEANKDRPRFKSFFDLDLYKVLFGYKYQPKLEELMDNYLRNKKVLVIGASQSDISLVVKHSKNIEAIDISERMVSEIKKMFPKVKAFVGDAEELDKLGRSYDVVFCRSILHHLHPFEEIVEQVASVLKKDGVMFVASEPGYYNPFAWMGRKFSPSKEHTPGEKAFDFGEYERVIGKYFEPEFVDYYFLVSMMLVIVPTKIGWLKELMRMLLKPTIKLEMWLRKLPMLYRFYWVTMGVYKVK